MRFEPSEGKRFLLFCECNLRIDLGDMPFDRCLLVADCCIALIAKSDDKLRYTFSLPADYTDPNNPHHYIAELNPHLYISKHRGDSDTEYLLENFEQTLPRYQLRKRLRDYVEYLNDANDPSSIVVLFACAGTADLLYVKRRVRSLVDDNDSLQVRVATSDKLKLSGITSDIWEEI